MHSTDSKTIARERFRFALAGPAMSGSRVELSFDFAENMAKHFESLLDRYLRDCRSPSIPPQLASFYADMSRRMFLYGLSLHFLLVSSSDRLAKRIGYYGLDSEHLYEVWETWTPTALAELDHYSRDNHGLPDNAFRLLYAFDVDDTVRQAGVWWFKRARIKTALRERFAAGITFGEVVDIGLDNMRVFSHGKPKVA
jgi:hypothetical protein